MKQRVRDIIGHGDSLWSKRSALTVLWQEIAENFYPERADFTVQRNVGTDFTAGLTTSYPMIARRELGNAFSSMLRPADKDWYGLRAEDDDRDQDPDARAWLEWAGGVMRKAMYARPAQFIRATKEGDMDFATFGQCVIQPTYNRDMTGLLYRSWHLRDCVWAENSELAIDCFHRKQKLTVRQLCQQFPGRVDARHLETLKTDPGREVEVRHVVMPFDEYDFHDPEARGRKQQPFVSIYVDKEHETVLEEIGIPDLGYVIPRWQTVSGSQYAHSPATVVGLADARLLQRISLTILEAGEKAVDPPMVAVAEHIQNGVNLYAGGVTYVDADYDERLGEVLRPLLTDVTGGLTNAKEQVADLREMLSHAFFLNKINLPEPGKDMTAFEVSKRMDEYVRGALPLFEPASDEFNGQLCEQTMHLLMRANTFGPPDSIPEAIAGADVRFSFESPLRSATDRQNANLFQETAGLLKVAAEAEQLALQSKSGAVVDLDTSFRDALRGVGVPSKWVRSGQLVQQLEQQKAEAADAAQQTPEAIMGQVGQGAMVAEQVGKAGQALHGAGLLPADMLKMLSGGAAQALPNGAAEAKAGVAPPQAA